MSHEIVMPQMGMSMDSGAIIRWLKQNGEWVVNGELLLEVEGDKATVEVEAVADGFLQAVAGPDDGLIAVGNVIGYLLGAGEQRPGAASPPSVTATSEAAPTPPERRTDAHAPQPKAANAVVAGRPPASPAARRRAQELGVDWRSATGTGPQGAVKERDILALAARLAVERTPDRVRISPVARRVAEAAGLDADVLARQTRKRLERADVEQAIAAQAAAQAMAEKPAVSLGKTGRRQAMSHLRRLIAERMAHSASVTAAVTLTTDADATDLVRLREGLKTDRHVTVVPSYNALMAKLAAKALLEHPALNASIEGQAIVYWETVNIGIAVDTERGLCVPVTRDVQDKPMPELAREMDERLRRAQAGKATPDELTGGTFTITNLGMCDIDAFTPIINPPECAILGVGRLVERVVPVNGLPAVRTMAALSLTFDHRLVDGAPAARFLQRVRQLVQQPYLWLY